ncbi:MAG TPA: CPBP family intramembrane glutamic endopeptidase [Flavisolibacter sp.]|nr:CPBP family intramembrane glutamic endopeptidase [Flavisolibacter sp.]
MSRIRQMKKIIGYLREYFVNIDKRMLLLATIFTAIIVFCNYYFDLNRSIRLLDATFQYLCWFFIFLFAFGFGYWLYYLFSPSSILRNRMFWVLLLLAPAVFSWKMVYSLDIQFSTNYFENRYWTAVVYWPFKVAVITGLLFIIHQLSGREKSFYGVSTKNFSAKPYLVMLLLMVPLVAVASTQPDFLAMYPRMQNIEYLQQTGKGWHKLLYQLSYGTDFFSIELFFRGFLILAFAKYAGQAAILPMAIFYCAIHFGKPLGECISSYFGGLILGVVSYHTQTILGGFLVHVGIAWLMELGGYIGQHYF